MSFLVVNGATCQCSFGVTPCVMVIQPSGVMANNMPVASIMDNKITNISGFGMCKSMANPAVSSATSAALGVLTPQPCVPIISSPWSPGSTNVLIGQNPALTNTSKVLCNYGGIIEIKNPAQKTVQVS